MSDISVHTIGVRGGKLSTKRSVGLVKVDLRHPEDIIMVDDYQGTGSDYKKRELSLITISQNGKCMFSGTKYELYEILEKNKK